jgi:hypothetical protein
MTDTDINLLEPGECDEPFPVPALERTYRVYVPLLNLVAPDSETKLGPPNTPTSSLLFRAADVARLDRAADAFGGIPLNALESSQDARWKEPTLNAVEVRDPVGLIRRMSVVAREGSDATVRLAMTAKHVSELLDRGTTLAPRADGGFVSLKLSPGATKPVVHEVDDLQSFLTDPAVVSRDGRRRVARLSASDLSKLAASIPVVSGTGASGTILVRRSRPGRRHDCHYLRTRIIEHIRID